MSSSTVSSPTARVLATVGIAMAIGHPTPAAAWAPLPKAPTGTATGVPVCTINDQRVMELSGLAIHNSKYIAINDSNDDPSAMRIFFLDDQCRLTDSVGYPTTARDPEDLAIGPDGSLWIADTGDNANSDSHRETVAVWRLPPGSRNPVIHRLSYPDGHHDCEAMVIDKDGLPLLITKDIAGSAGLFKPTQKLISDTSEGVPLAQVGQFRPRQTGTPNPFGFAGRNAVTAATVSPDRSRVAIRTYSDVYEFDISHGTIVTAIDKGTPRITALPDEPQGEAIAYTSDGTAFVTVSDVSGPTPILRYPPHATGTRPTSPQLSPQLSPPGDRSAGGGTSLTSATAEHTQTTSFSSGPHTFMIILGCIVSFIAVLVLYVRQRP